MARKPANKKPRTTAKVPATPPAAPSPLKAGRAPRGEGWQAGFAQGDITPPKGHTLMSGYGRERYANGAIAPLLAQALALADKSGNVAVLVTADILGFDRMTVGAIRVALAKKHGLAPASIMLSASHTHWGAGTLFKVNFATGALNPFYVRRVEAEMLRVVDESAARLLASSAGPTARRQGLRELSLMAASDWPFLTRDGSAATYARSRVADHHAALRAVLAGAPSAARSARYGWPADDLIDDVLARAVW